MQKNLCLGNDNNGKVARTHFILYFAHQYLMKAHGGKCLWRLIECVFGET